VIPISGEQFELEFGRYAATIASVGASIRSLTCDGRDLVVPFAATEVRPAFRGATLAPWPNRVVDATYSFRGTEYLLAVSEPKRGHALHGLVAWSSFALVGHTPQSVSLATTIEAQTSYPFRLDILVDFRLDADGLHSTVSARNTGTDAAPYGVAQHPYLRAGAGRVDDWSLSVPARTVMMVTDDRLIPTGTSPVTATELDFRSVRPIGGTFIDHAFTDFDDREVRVLDATGTSGVAMTWDAACPWVQVHTGDQPDREVDRIGLAVEPMTCPPDAFNSGVDLIILEPGDRTSASWTIGAIGVEG
jgi:aldose 1-epimerase